MLEQYDKNVRIVMDFLTKERYSASVISEHRVCYRIFREYLDAHGIEFSREVSFDWLEKNRCVLKKHRYTRYKHALSQLNDIYESGCVSRDSLGYRVPSYAILIPSLRKEVDDFIASDAFFSKDTRYRINCSRFMEYLQRHGISSLSELNYDTLLRFREDDYHRSWKSKDIYEAMIRRMLRYYADKGICSLGLSLALNKQLIPQFIRIDEKIISGIQSEDTYDIRWNEIDTFLSLLKITGYSNTVLNASKHTLVLLYIFLDMHSTKLSENLMWFWFDAFKGDAGTGWKQIRRTLSQFIIFIKTGNLTTEITGAHDKVSKIDNLPEWFREPLKEYLNVLKREGWKKSTIDMQKSSNIRFGAFLQKAGLTSLNQITPDILKAFNAQDIHSTAEAKAAYNSRIRGFVIYLNDYGYLTAPNLHKALPSIAAPKTRIAEVLSTEDIDAIFKVNSDNLNPLDLRSYAMLCIGLSMGLRASDIVSIRFEDIDWKNQCIHVIQQKTGKAISMPMPTHVGNIMFKYICKERPKSRSNHIFISHRAPFKKLDTTACSRAIKRFLPDTAHNGFHILRKTFATSLLRGGNKVELISDSLGHSTDDTVNVYLSLDEEHMRMCSLSLEETGISFSGGVFDA